MVIRGVRRCNLLGLQNCSGVESLPVTTGLTAIFALGYLPRPTQRASTDADIHCGSSRVASNQTEGSHVFGHNRPSRNDRIGSQFEPRANNRTGSDRTASPHDRSFEPILFRVIASRSLNHARRAWVAIVCKRHSGTDKNVVFNDDPFPDQHLVLDRDVVADHGTSF